MPDKQIKEHWAKTFLGLCNVNKQTTQIKNVGKIHILLTRKYNKKQTKILRIFSLLGHQGFTLIYIFYRYSIKDIMVYC